MNTQKHSFFALALLPFTCLLAVASSSSPAAHRGIGPHTAIDDWSHHHIVFSNPGTEEESWQRGDHDRWLQITGDPRFKLQQLKRSAAGESNATPLEEPESSSAQDDDDSAVATEPAPIDLASLFPDGKLPRWIVPVPESELPQINAGRGKPPHAPKLIHVHKKLHTDWSVNMGSNATVGMGMFPAKFSFDVTAANCASAPTPDFVVYNTSLAGSATQASVIAYDNLYSGCATGTVPSTFWAYNTNGGTVVTSVILSLDGSQVAFAQSSGGSASLVILKWKASNTNSASNPVTLTSTAAASYRACVAPCMTVIAFSGGADDTFSAPFFDYSGADTLYIGDDSGKLHKFTGVFSGTPAEALSSWPVTVSTSSSALSSPVYDSTSGRIFVGDSIPPSMSHCLSIAPCGLLYAVSASTAAVVGTSSRLDFNQGIVDAPLVDSAAAKVYAFIGDDGNNGSGSPCAPFNCSGIFQFAASFTSGAGTEATVGNGFNALYSGTFDNAYFTSALGSAPTGHLYVVGGSGHQDNTLYQVTIAANVMSTTAVTGPALSSNFSSTLVHEQVSGFQVTEFFNGTQDFIFTSVPIAGVASPCASSPSNGCVLGFNVTTGVITPLTAPVIAAAENGGASGIVIDNRSAFGGASQIYFTPVLNQLCTTSGTTGGCAIQTAQ